MATPHVPVGDACLREAGDVEGAISAEGRRDDFTTGRPGRLLLAERHLDVHGDPLRCHDALDHAVAVLPPKSVHHFLIVVATHRIPALEQGGIGGGSEHRTLDGLRPAQGSEVDLPSASRGDLHLESRRCPRGLAGHLLLAGQLADEPLRRIDRRFDLGRRRRRVGDGDDGQYDCHRYQ